MPAAYHPAGAGALCADAAHAAHRTSYRCPRKTRSGPSAARLADDHPEKRRMTLMQRLASVGLGRRDTRHAPPTAAMPRADPAQCRNTSVRRSARQRSPAGRPPGRAGLGICPPDGAAGPRPPWPRRHLCIIPARMTSSISRPSCAARPTEAPRLPERPRSRIHERGRSLMPRSLVNSIDTVIMFSTLP